MESAVFRLPLSKLFVREGKEWAEAGAAALMPSKADAPARPSPERSRVGVAETHAFRR